MLFCKLGQQSTQKHSKYCKLKLKITKPATFLLCLPWSKQNNSKLPLKYTRLQTRLLQSPLKNRGWWQRLHFLPCLHTHWISFVLLWRRKTLASWLPNPLEKESVQKFSIIPPKMDFANLLGLLKLTALLQQKGRSQTSTQAGREGVPAVGYGVTHA